MRTTLDIDSPVLAELKMLQKKENEPLGKLVSRLLARALADMNGLKREVARPEWITKSMGSRVDLDDKDAVYGILDGTGKE